jgi:hypothetical protein
MPELAVHSAARIPKGTLPLPDDRVISTMTWRMSSNAVPGSVVLMYSSRSAVS